MQKRTFIVSQEQYFRTNEIIIDFQIHLSVFSQRDIVLIKKAEKQAYRSRFTYELRLN